VMLILNSERWRYLFFPCLFLQRDAQSFL
jgi:hypothetical protein